MVVCLANKQQADAFLEKSVIEVREDAAYMKPSQEASFEEKQCFNC